MKNYLICAIAALFFLSACKKTAIDESPVSEELLSTETIDAFIKKEHTEHGEFKWQWADAQMIWSALQHSDNVMSIGYKPASIGNIEESMHEIDIRDEAWECAKNEVLQIVFRYEQKLNPSLKPEQVIQWDEAVLPVLNVNVKNIATVKALLASNLVRYAEPMGYEPREVVLSNQNQTPGDNAVASSSGCGSNIAEPGLMANVDYVSIAPNTKQSWNYTYHKIPQAWTKTTGSGVKVFVIDTGCEFDQENLGSAFNQGSSSGRTIERIVTLPRQTFFGIPTGPVETADDGCGHGTSMAGVLAAPRGTDGNACGVAYNSSLVTCRAASTVLIENSRDAKGVADAFTNAANRADVKIISMSLGRITSNSQIRDAIIYAYGKNKLIFCAAGTSYNWASGWYGVIFPASMSQVNSVTGVKEGNFNASCSDCHSGSANDFTVVMQKTSNDQVPLSLAVSGDAPSTVGGSSVATATAAAIAALTWSRFPALTRDQVLNKLIQTSSNYPTRNGSYGWGNLNADAATN